MLLDPLDVMDNARFIPLFSDDSSGVMCRVMDACVAAMKKTGVQALPIAYNCRKHSWATLGFANVAKHALMNYPDRVVLGGCSCILPEAAEVMIDLGARFVVAPYLNAKMIRVCAERGVPCLPASSSVHEIIAAYVTQRECGVARPAVSITPQPGGADTLQHALAALGMLDLLGDGREHPRLLLVPTGLGGDELEQAETWFKINVPSGRVLAVGGSESLLSDADLSAGASEIIIERLAHLLRQLDSQ